MLMKPYFFHAVIICSFYSSAFIIKHLYNHQNRNFNYESIHKKQAIKVKSNLLLYSNSDAISNLITQTRELEIEATSCIENSSNSKELELLRVLYLGTHLLISYKLILISYFLYFFIGKSGKITGMMKEMKSLSKEEKPRLGEVVNSVVKKVEEAIESTKVLILEKEALLLLEKDDLGNTIQISAVPMLYNPLGTRHPINLVMDLTCEIFEDIGYEVT